MHPQDTPAPTNPAQNGSLQELFSLSGRTALVTGGSSGIGQAMAEAIGRAGAAVVIVARRQSELDRATGRLRDLGVRAASIAGDLGEAADVRRVCDQAAALFGEIDILVNVAANNIRRPMGELTPEDYDLTMRVNITAPYTLGQHFGPRMAERGWGRIINVGSQQSISAFGDSGAYGVSKAAITGLSRSQAEAWSRHGVCSNTVVPGFVLTPLTAPAQAIPGRVEALAARSMAGRNGLPADFAGIAVMLAGDASAYITGQTICVDGGFSVH
ncbi:SDR family NAD(P)-dependent oxidoreductase [Sphaerisporangium perillae]|uniref:SDR family NAD(P)-dependent oxidoreductase n=1 Tax=Sphaerisporangium perillae TaxID=2935860 RepID=UPI00200D846F|nr:SDR family oxidoreductase [Sphaerisporangium perillae]